MSIDYEKFHDAAFVKHEINEKSDLRESLKPINLKTENLFYLLIEWITLKAY